MNSGDSATRQEVRLGGPPIGPGVEDITWPDQVAPWGRKACSTRKIKPQTSKGTQGAYQTFKEGPYQDRPLLCPFRLLPLLTCP